MPMGFRFTRQIKELIKHYNIICRYYLCDLLFDVNYYA